MLDDFSDIVVQKPSNEEKDFAVALQEPSPQTTQPLPLDSYPPQFQRTETLPVGPGEVKPNAVLGKGGFELASLGLSLPKESAESLGDDSLRFNLLLETMKKGDDRVIENSGLDLEETIPREGDEMNIEQVEEEFIPLIVPRKLPSWMLDKVQLAEVLLLPFLPK